MFTGLISAVGTVSRIVPRDGGLTLDIAASYDDLEPGESIAVNGACLTVESAAAGEFAVHVVATSLARTTFGARRSGDRLNLERALRMGDRLGGHWVQGHVDGVGVVLDVATRDGVRLIDVRLPAPVAEVSIALGSLTVDGVSLTINAMPAPDVAQVAIIPHTLRHTTLAALATGDRVHLEGDLVGKHVRAMAAPWSAAGGAR